MERSPFLSALFALALTDRFLSAKIPKRGPACMEKCLDGLMFNKIGKLKYPNFIFETEERSKD